MNLREIKSDDLVSLRSKITQELFKRRHGLNVEKKRYKTPKMRSSEMLVKFISKGLGYDITMTNRRGRYTFPRYVVANYLLINTNDTLENIASYIGITHHSTVYNMIEKHNNLLSTNDAEYIIYNDRLSNLIKEFTNNNKLQKAS